MNRGRFGLVLGVITCATLIGFGITQEVPVGQVQGKVRMLENGRPLPQALVSLRYSDSTKIKPITTETKGDGSFRLNRIPTGDYLLTVSSANHQLQNRPVHIEEGQRLDMDVEAAPSDPHLETRAAQNVFLPGEAPSLTIKGFVLEPALRINIWKLKPETIAQSGGAGPALEPIVTQWGQKRGSLSEVASLIQGTDHPIQKRDVEGTFIEPIRLPTLGEGVYYVENKAGISSSGAVIYVSSIALVTKSSGSDVHCFVTDMKSGNPVANAEILHVADHKLVRDTTTDAQGFARVTSGKGREVVVARLGEAYALSRFYGREEEGEGKPGKNVIYTDRPIYRPGDRVEFKGIVRSLVDGNFQLPGRGTAKITITDPDDNVISEQTTALNAHGTYAGSFVTNLEAKPGGYNISCEAFGIKGNHYASIAAYRKPEFDVKLKATRDHFVLGEEASVEVTCRYYFGGPVAGATIHASIFRNPLWNSDFDDLGDDLAEDADTVDVSDTVGGEYSADAVVTTDANGKATVKFPTRVDKDPDNFSQDYTYSVSVYSSEANSGPSFEAHGDVRVTRGDIDLQAKPSAEVIDPGQPVTIDVETRTQSADRSAVAKQPVTVRFGREKWSDNRSVFTELATQTAMTGADGKVSVPVPASIRGNLAIQVETRDRAGRKVVAHAWIFTDEALAGEVATKFEIKLDKKQYREGDMATALLTCSDAGGTAWITAEADGLIESRAVKISGPSTRIKIPVRHAMAPNCFISAAYVRNKKFSQASRRLLIDRGTKRLSVDVQVDRTQIQPGERCQVTVETKDETGKPVDAEISLATVDESIFAIKADSTNLLKDFYPRRGNQVSTSFSFPEIHLDGGDKGGGNIPVRTRFLDTAQWDPHVETKGGKGTVSLRVPDNLTRWRITAVGVSDETAVGLGKSSVVVKKPIMVRLSGPRFMVQGDRIEAGMTVHNDSGKSQRIHVSLETQGVSNQVRVPAEFDLPDGGVKQLSLDLIAERSGRARLTGKAWVEGGSSDGVELILPVEPHGRLWVDGHSGSFTGEHMETFTVRDSADPNAGGLSVSVAPSLASSLIRSLDSLVDYPYGCVEQTMSRFMPAILVQKLLRDSGYARPDLEKKVPLIAADGFARLAKMQHGDGAWGWWEHDRSDVYMTSLVLDGLARAKVSGYTSPIKIERAVEWLANQTKAHIDPKASAWTRDLAWRDRAYASYALAISGRPKEALEASRGIPAKARNAEISALLLLSAEAVAANGGADGDIGRRDATALVESLVAQADAGADSAAWKASPYTSTTEVQATALTAIMTAAPSNPIVPKAIRSLTSMRKGDSWESTRATAYSIIALTRYLEQTKELIGSKTVSLEVNGKSVFTKSWAPGQFELGTIEIPMSELRSGKNDIRFSSNGSAAYFTTQIKQFDVHTPIGQLVTNSDMSVTRTYRRMEMRALEDGTQKLVPSEKSVTQVAVGDIIQCEIKLKASGVLQYVLIEDPIPSNCSVVEREQIEEYGRWNYLWSGIQIMDDRIGLFISRMDASVQTIRYTLRAESVGKVHSLPVRIEEMYRPENWTSSAENELEVVR